MSSSSRRQPAWLGWPLGTRVTIRRRLPEGGFSDWVGRLEDAGPGHVVVRRRSGEARRFEAAEIAIAHRVRERSPRSGV